MLKYLAFSASNIQGEIVFQKLQNLGVAKALMSSYILCKILNFLTRVAQKVFNRPGSYSLVELIILWSFNIQNWFICSSIKNRIAYANEANIVNKDSPIGKLESMKGQCSRLGRANTWSFFFFSFFPLTCFFFLFPQEVNKCFPFPIIIYYFARYSCIACIMLLNPGAPVHFVTRTTKAF